MHNTLANAREFVKKMDERNHGQWWTEDNEEIAKVLVEYANATLLPECPCNGSLNTITGESVHNDKICIKHKEVLC
jgi:hypothetical protein